MKYANIFRFVSFLVISRGNVISDREVIENTNEPP